MVHGSIHYLVHGSVHALIHGLVHDLLKMSLIMFYLNMLDYPVFFPLLSTLTWDTVLTPRGTLGFYSDHIHLLTPFKSCGWVGVGWWGGLRF